MKNGWLNLYKPVGISSAAAVAIVKRTFGKAVKVGHTGTLDVEAEGVLPIAVGEATKLVQFLMDARKTYRFTVKFGATTDTGRSRPTAWGPAEPPLTLGARPLWIPGQGACS